MKFRFPRRSSTWAWWGPIRPSMSRSTGVLWWPRCRTLWGRLRRRPRWACWRLSTGRGRWWSWRASWRASSTLIWIRRAWASTDTICRIWVSFCLNWSLFVFGVLRKKGFFYCSKKFVLLLKDVQKILRILSVKMGFGFFFQGFQLKKPFFKRWLFVSKNYKSHYFKKNLKILFFESFFGESSRNDLKLF